MDKDTAITFYVDLPEGEIDQLKNYLLRYIDDRTEKYLITHREDGQGKQYGKVTNIRDINKMITYCLKDEGERRTNLSDQDIDDFLRASLDRKSVV